eukprot:scaffold2462_cov127-Cylindrotheca_fusiformis.AAC.10
MQGLTDGMSNRYLRGNRSSLLPSLENMRAEQTAHRSKALHGRLEELLVFEILKDGGTEYHTFTVRSLHKYVVNAITRSRERKIPRNMMENYALGRAIVNQPFQLATNKEKDPLTETKQYDITSTQLKQREEREHLRKAGKGQEAEEKGKDVTYRELLGGFLHPRDMRKLVTPFSASNEPELIVRRHAMLLNFDPLRAIILRDRLLVLVPDGADSILAQLEHMILNESSDHGDEYGENGSLNEDHKDYNGKKDERNSSYTEDDDDESEIVFDSPPPLQMMNLDNLGDGNPVYPEELDRQNVVNNVAGQGEWAELEGNTWIDLPFELQCVDAILNSVCGILAEDVQDLQLSANSMISELLTPGADVGDHAQDVLRTMKNSVKEMMSRVDGFCRAMDTLLEDYEDMALMNLSRILTNPDRFIQPVSQAILDEESDEPELILEAHVQRGHTLTNALHLVQGQINSTEEYAVQKSDSIRNRLLYINMLISLLSLAVAAASLVGSLFGMNVANPLEQDSEGFMVITLATVFGSLIFVLFMLLLIRRVGVMPKIF